MPIIIQDWHNKKYDVIIDGQHCKFKSKFEYRWALYLQRLVELDVIESWEYEPKRFWFLEIKQGVRGYTPDFRVVETETNPAYQPPRFLDEGETYSVPATIRTTMWHETKVHLIQKDITKYHRMQIYHPDEKLILVMDRRKGRRAKHKQVNLLAFADKYTYNILYADEMKLFKMIKVD